MKHQQRLQYKYVARHPSLHRTILCVYRTYMVYGICCRTHIAKDFGWNCWSRFAWAWQTTETIWNCSAAKSFIWNCVTILNWSEILTWTHFTPSCNESNTIGRFECCTMILFALKIFILCELLERKPNEFRWICFIHNDETSYTKWRNDSLAQKDKWEESKIKLTTNSLWKIIFNSTANGPQ